MDHTLLGELTDLSVDVNGLVVPASAIEKTLARFAFNLIVLNDDETFRLSLLGSATAVRFRGRELLLATQHQLQGVDESKVAMLTDTGSHAITSGGRRGFHPSKDTDAYDIVAFDFTEPCRDRPELKKRFFNLAGRPPDVPSSHVMAVLVTGCLTGEQRYEIHENNHLGCFGARSFANSTVTRCQTRH